MVDLNHRLVEMNQSFLCSGAGMPCGRLAAAFPALVREMPGVLS